MKVMIRKVQDNNVKYDGIMFVCPGCKEMSSSSGLHLLPVNSTVKSPSWDWDQNIEKPTLSPSILTKNHNGGVCHSYLRAGVIEYLNDCTHSMVGKKVELPDLPQWVLKEGNNDNNAL